MLAAFGVLYCNCMKIKDFLKLYAVIHASEPTLIPHYENNFIKP